MVKKAKKGVSLMSALLLITIVMLVAATMAGVFTMNMNITNRVSNGSIALSEAEAGISEVLYQITREENIEEPKDDALVEESIEGDGNGQKTPKVTWGLNGETIRSTITSEMSEDEAFHVVTFNPGSDFPHSTNNTTLDHDSGSLGRTVPDGMIHIVSTGYCKGQYRTIECLVEKPPFPFGLATSGPIVSNDPLIVKGTSTLESYKDGEEDRPGHIVCNSPEGVTIGAAPPGSGKATLISGFLKSTGPATVEQPATIRGGIRTFADESTLVDIDISKFNLSGQDGVVTLIDNVYNQAQEMDVMYRYTGGHLQYMSRVNLKQAMLYVDGDLTIHGPVTGQGLIVVNGNATFNSGSNLDGTNKMAILASGDITIRGNDNFFTGLIYSEGNFNASNVTIVGNTIVSSSDSSKGRAELDNVTIVANDETADMTIVVNSSGVLQIGTDLGNGVIPNVFSGNFGPRSDGQGYISANDSDSHIQFIANNQLKMEVLDPVFSVGADTIVPFERPQPQGDAGPLWDQAQVLQEVAIDVQAEWADLDAQIKTKNDKIDDLQEEEDDDEDGGTDNSGEIAALRDQIAGLEEDKAKAKADAEAAFLKEAEKLVEDIRSYAQSHTDSNGGGNSTLTEGEDSVTRTEHFDLNEHLPESEKIKISFWKVYPRRL
jgi:hypothetical protein